MQKKIGVLGLGSIGMRHKANLEKIGCRVSWYDPAPTTIWESGYSRLNAINDSDAIVIASPTSQHHQDIIDGLMAIKPCFVEKPITDRLDINVQSVLMVGYNLRFHPCVKKADEWLGQEMIGTPLWANFCCAQYNDKPAYLRDGVILNWSHEIDLALYLLGPAKVTGSSTRLTDGKDDVTDILMTHDNGCMTSIHLDYLTKDELRGFTIYGTEGNMNIGLNSGMMFAHLGGHEPMRLETDWNDIYLEEMEAFIRRIDGAVTLGATAQDGLDTLKICLEVRRQAGLI